MYIFIWSDNIMMIVIMIVVIVIGMVIVMMIIVIMIVMITMVCRTTRRLGFRVYVLRLVVRLRLGGSQPGQPP